MPCCRPAILAIAGSRYGLYRHLAVVPLVQLSFPRLVAAGSGTYRRGRKISGVTPDSPLISLQAGSQRTISPFFVQRFERCRYPRPSPTPNARRPNMYTLTCRDRTGSLNSFIRPVSEEENRVLDRIAQSSTSHRRDVLRRRYPIISARTVTESATRILRRSMRNLRQFSITEIARAQTRIPANVLSHRRKRSRGTSDEGFQALSRCEVSNYNRDAADDDGRTRSSRSPHLAS